LAVGNVELINILTYTPLTLLRVMGIIHSYCECAQLPVFGFERLRLRSPCLGETLGTGHIFF